MQTAYDMFRLSRERTPDHPAIVDTGSGQRLGYRELGEAIEACAAGLAERGVGPGERIATVLPNRLEHCLVLLALQRLGAVPALVNPRLKPPEVAGLVRQGEMAGAVVLAAPPLIEAVREALPAGAPLLVVGDGVVGGGDATEVGGAVDFAACRGDPGALPPEPRPAPDDAAFVFYTSGTTGLPKGVLIPHRAAEPRVLFLCAQAGFRHGTHNRIIGLMPLAHVIGFYAVFLAALALNGTYYLVPAFNPAGALDIIEDEAVTSLFAAPTHYHALLAAPNFSTDKVRSLELLLYGGASMNPDLLERVDGAFPGTLRQIYGTTETMNSLHMPDPVGRPHTLRPGFYSAVRVVRIGGGVDDLAAPGEEGEILVDAAADATFIGYLNRPDATAASLVEGWYRTGDAGFVDERGDIVLKGRVDDMIVSGAENIHPAEVEAVLTGHPAVADAALVGLADDRWGEVGVACVARAESAPDALDADALDAHCRASVLADYKRPRAYLFVDRLPRNAANKVLRGALREAVAAARESEGGLAYPGARG